MSLSVDRGECREQPSRIMNLKDSRRLSCPGYGSSSTTFEHHHSDRFISRCMQAESIILSAHHADKGKEAFKASFNSFSVRLLSNDHLIIVIEIEQAEVISGQYVTFFEVVS